MLAAGAGHSIVVQLADGVYRLSHTFELAEADSGPDSNRPTIYKAAPDAHPVLSGSLAVKGFVPVPGDALVWVASVPVGLKSRQLWVNGRRAVRARSAEFPAGYTATSAGFTLGNPAMVNWPDRSQIEVVGTWQWQMYRCPVSAIDVSGGLTLAQPCWGAVQGNRFSKVAWLENARELLTSPGQFFLDSAAGKLYYAPRPNESLSSADVELPVVETLVSAFGTPDAPVHDLRMQGIQFSYATWLAPNTVDGYISSQASITSRGSPSVLQKPLANVSLHATHNMTLSSCTFSHLGGTGLALEVGSQDNLIESSRFEDISASAIMIGDVTHANDHHPSDSTTIVKNNTVRNSYVTRAGAEYYDAAGIFVGYTTHTTLANNELFDLPYTGISIGWGWGTTDPGGSEGYSNPTSSQNNEITCNQISYHMRQLTDGGGIYALGAQPGSIMRGNFISNQGAPYGNLYLDNGAKGWNVTNNVALLYAKESGLEIGNTWLYVQVFPTIATNNSASNNFANNSSLFTPNPIDPSNNISPATLLAGADLSPAASILAQAGTTLRAPEVARGKPATASSQWDASYPPATANDGNTFSGWSPAASDTNPWCQVDLGAVMNIDGIEVVSRFEYDQPVTRRNYRIRASSDRDFASAAILGEVDNAGLPHKAIFSVDVKPAVSARYIRVEKTVPEYFFLGEVRVHAH